MDLPSRLSPPFKLFSNEDYISVASELSQASDVQNLLDFMLHLLRDHQLPNQAIDINRGARRFIFKVISNIVRSCVMRR